MGVPAKNPELPRQTGPMLEPPPPSGSQSALEIADATVRNFSIVMGGPLYDWLLRKGALRFVLPNLARRIVILVALTWLPLLLLSLKDGVAFGNQVRIPLLYDVSMYARFLLCLPLLLLAEIVIDPSIREAVGEFVNGGIVPAEELPKFDRVLESTQRLRDSWIPEAVIFVLAFFPVFLFEREWGSAAVSSWHTTSGGLTAAGYWYALFSTPVLRFLIYRWVFRYFIWALLLWRISRLHLILPPTHPDHAGGLNFLGLAQKHFGILFCALGCIFSGRMTNDMLFEAAPLSSFRFLVVGFIVLSMIVGILPLTLLAPKLSKIRKAGLLEYGKLAHSYTQSFDQKWVHYGERPAEPLLGTGDIQSLADLGNSFGLVKAMNIAPITKSLLVQLGAQTVLPLLPVIVLGTPTPELVRAVMKMLVP
ncbi:MAG TPA: hypothetical protein VMH03_09005 [Terriglobales bacterium]|nr:hypothetical protein [Terriglobales bacterium]